MLKLAIEKGVLISVVLLMLCLFGVIAIVTVPVQMIPDMEATVIKVTTRWSGATPQDVEQEILVEQEEYLRKIPNLNKMTAEAKTGVATIELEFDLGTDIQEALVRVNNALSQVPSYPENVDQPRLTTSSTSDQSFMFFSVRKRSDAPEDLELPMQLDFLDDVVATAIERVAGVSEVNFRDGTSRQIQIYVDPARLAEREITITQLRNAMRARNRDVSGGDIDSGKRRYLVRTLGRFESVQEIEDTVIIEREGVLVRLRDLGHAELGHTELRAVAYRNGERNIIFSIKRQVGANVIETMEGVMAEVERLNNTVLKDRGLTIELASDDVKYVQASIRVVEKNLALGGLFACVVLYLFLRSLFPTLLGTLGVPICTVGAFLGLLVMGRTINVISLAGIAFAIGMTLDNSIVVLENIYRHRAMGKTRFQAALDGVQEVWKAVLASTLTTVFVFLPIVLIQEEAGQLYSDIAIAVSAAIIMSMVVAITVIPSATARLPLAMPQGGGALNALGGLFSRYIMTFVSWLTGGIWRRLTLIGGVLMLAFGIMFFLTPQAEYLPEGEEAKIFAFMFAPPGYNIEEMDTIAREMETYFVPHVGASAEAFEAGVTDVPPLDTYFRVASSERLFTVSTTRSTDPDHISALQNALLRKYSEVPGMIAFASKGSIFAGNLAGSRSIELDIKGPDLPVLYDSAMQSFIKARQVFQNPRIRPQPGLSLSQPTVEIRPNWNRAAELGVRTEDLGYLIWALSDGAYMDEFFLADDKIDMFLYSTTGTVKNPQDIAQLPVYSPKGGIVPLGAIAEIRETVSAHTIRRVDGERTVTLAIVPPREIALETAVGMVEREIIQGFKASGRIPANVTIEIAGASDKLRSTREALSGNFLIAVLLSYLLMVAIFSHWGYPLIILLSIPVGISGGIVGLWLMNNVAGISMPFDMITMLGMVVVIGIVVNNPILLVEQARTFMRREGMTPRRAVIQSTQTRLRPIMMSMLTTVFGLSPVVFMPGAGTELYRGLGTIVLFGLFFSTIVTLTFIPALLSLVLQLVARIGTKRSRGSKTRYAEISN